jgi:glycosyltransferase involved in cell wall biosynthesis
MREMPNPRPRVVLLTATFPPRGGSGVQRVWYQTKAIAAAGLDLHVVTERATATWVSDSKGSDDSLGMAISRCDESPSRVLRLLSRVASKVTKTPMYPDGHWQWIFAAYRECCRALNTTDASVLLVSFGHPSALIAAALVKRRNTDVKLIIDVRDLWVGNPNGFSYVRNRGPLAKIDRWIERWAFAKADGVIGVSSGIIEEIGRRYQWFKEEQLHVIQNGFDESLYESSSVPKTGCHEGQTIVFRHVGFVGPTQRLDVFLNAVRQLKREDTEKLANVRFEFIGGNPGYVRSLASSIGVDDLVHCTEYVEHGQAVELMCDADVLLLFWGLGKGTIGGKTYEYLRANRFIMAFDQGNRDGRALLEETRRGNWVAADDLPGQIAMIDSLISRLRSGVALLSEPLIPVDEYSRESQNVRLLEVLDATLD